MIAAPSDRFISGSVVRVGGRIISVDGSELWLADATSAIHVQLSQTTTAEAGSLAVVEGRWTGRFLEQSSLLEVHAYDPQPATSEHGRLLYEGLGARLLARAEAFRTIRQFFDDRGFVEVDTPQRVISPGSDPNVEAIASEERFLITSPEHHLKRLLAGGMHRIYQMSHCFRHEERGYLHQPEFTLLEWYRAFAGIQQTMEDTEAVVRDVVQALQPWRTASGTPPSALKLNLGTQVDLEPSFIRISVREAFARFAGIDDAIAMATENENEYFQCWVDRVEPELARQQRPVFVYDFPATQAALARASATDPTVCERFELYLGGIELCNGYGELTDADELQQRIQLEQQRRKKSGRQPYPVDVALVAALREGLPPSSGNALGADRLILVALEQSELSAVTPFSVPAS